MRRDFIKYEQLSKDIKKEIQTFFDEKKKTGKNLSIQDAMTDWFEMEFDTWMVRNYSGKKDRRQVERRKHPRIPIENDQNQRSKDRRGTIRRKHFRLDIEVPVRVVEMLIESTSEEVNAIDYVGTLMNISKGGFYFRFTKSIEPSSIIRVSIDLSVLDPDLNEIEALAMVVRTDMLPDKTYGVGVMFSSIYDEHRENLEIFLFKNLAYYIYSK